MLGRRNVAALTAEFLGTAVLTLLVLSVQRSQLGVSIFIALGAGLAVVIMAMAVGRVSGAHFNPALTIGLLTARRITVIRALAYLIAQFLGAWAAYALYKYLAKNSVMPDISGKFSWQAVTAEAVGTAIFAFAVASAIYQRFTVTATAAAAGLGLTLGIVAATTASASLGLLNPAVAVGINAFQWGNYVLGPVVGAVVGVNLYALLFAEPKALLATEAGSASAANTTAAAPVVVKPAAKRPSAKKPAAKRAKK